MREEDERQQLPQQWRARLQLAACGARGPLQQGGACELGAREHLVDQMAPDHDLVRVRVRVRVRVKVRVRVRVRVSPKPNLAPQREGHGAGGKLRPGELLVVGVGGREDLVRVRVRLT